jgi:hypothetical protein
MDTKKLILFNGAKGCGKNFAIDYLLSECYELDYAECKNLLHELTMLFFRVPQVEYWNIYEDRSCKELPNPFFKLFITIEQFNNLKEVLKGEFAAGNNITYHPTEHRVELNLSVREAMIFTSECIAKPSFGKDYFGKARVDKILYGENDLYVDSSCGFVEELPPVIEALGQENILLLRIHREGCTFEGDSRTFIPDGVINNTIDIVNNGTAEEYFAQIESAVANFI